MYPPPHDPAALAYQQWLQQQQPVPQYTTPPAFPYALPAGAQQPQLAPSAAPIAPQQYMPLPPAPLARPQYMSPSPVFQPSPFPSSAQRRPKQPRQQPQPEAEDSAFVSLWIVLVSLLLGAALGAAVEHHRLSPVVEAGVASP